MMVPSVGKRQDLRRSFVEYFNLSLIDHLLSVYWTLTRVLVALNTNLGDGTKPEITKAATQAF